MTAILGEYLDDPPRVRLCADTGTVYGDLIVQQDNKVVRLPSGEAYALAGSQLAKIARALVGCKDLDQIAAAVHRYGRGTEALLAGTVGGTFGLYLCVSGDVVGPLRAAGAGCGGTHATAAHAALTRAHGYDERHLVMAVGITYGLVDGVAGPAGGVNTVVRHDGAGYDMDVVVSTDGHREP